VYKQAMMAIADFREEIIKLIPKNNEDKLDILINNLAIACLSTEKTYLTANEARQCAEGNYPDWALPIVIANKIAEVQDEIHHAVELGLTCVTMIPTVVQNQAVADAVQKDVESRGYKMEFATNKTCVISW
jgi:hypothetical protein